MYVAQMRPPSGVYAGVFVYIKTQEKQTDAEPDKHLKVRFT